MSAPNVNQVNSSIFGMASAMFTSVAAAVVTTAVQSNRFIDKTFSVMVHGVSAADNVASAVERRSQIYGEGIVRNGELAERETTLKYKLRLHNLEEQERRVLEGVEEYVPEKTVSERVSEAVSSIKTAVSGSANEASTQPVEVTGAAGGSVKITPAVSK